MSLIIIFVFGVVVTGIAVSAGILIGISEKHDPDHNRYL
jgi:hypothetical protein